MFKNIFSFEGRIRRLEYAITYLAFILLNISTLDLLDNTEFLNSLYFIIFIISYWILLAQGAKRCHDIGNNGFYQLIPFYFIIMIFDSGENHKNNYGFHPKSMEYREERNPLFPNFKLEINHLLVSQVLSISLLMVFGNALANFILLSSDAISFLLFFTLPIFGFFIFILLDEKSNSIRKTYKQFAFKQLFFSIIYFILMRMYSVAFLGADVDIETILIEFIVVSFLFGTTYISIGLHIMLFNQSKIHNE